MSAAHTPGPWLPQAGGKVVQGETGALVATVGPAFGAGRDERIAANARLIAAAPDLLAALRKCEHRLEVHLGSLRSVGAICTENTEVLLAEVRAAIAAAEGRT